MFGIEAALEGRLGRDPELKMVKGGTMPMVTLAVAVDEAPPKPGEEQRSTWVNCKLFGDKAAAAAEALAKGDRVYVEGKLTLDRWTTQAGEERSGLSMVANVAQPLGKIGQRRPKSDRPHRQGGDRLAAGARAQAPLEPPPHCRDDMDQAIPW